jgi:hypothetical protein
MIFELSLPFRAEPKIINKKRGATNLKGRAERQLVDVPLPVSRDSAGRARRRLVERMALGRGQGRAIDVL